MSSKRVAVVGSGMAGLSVASSVLKMDPLASVTVFSDRPLAETVSFNSGGGVTFKPPALSIDFTKTFSVALTNTNYKWVLSTLVSFVMNSTTNQLALRALVEESKTLMGSFGVVNALDANNSKSCDESHWYNVEMALNEMIVLLKAKNVVFVTGSVAGATDASLSGFDLVFMCRGAQDASVFGSATELVAGTVQDVTKPTSTARECFRFDKDRFVSSFDSKTRYTGGVHVGRTESSNKKEFSTGDTKELTPFSGARVLSTDMMPFYYRISDKVFYVNGGGFAGMFTYPAIAMMAAVHGMTGAKSVSSLTQQVNPELERITSSQTTQLMIGLAVVLPLISLVLFGLKMLFFLIRFLFSLIKV